MHSFSVSGRRFLSGIFQFLSSISTGCGIGVLLRMFWVLAVVSYRAFKGQREEDHEYSHVITIEEYEGSAAPLPPYTYPADEKVEIVTVKAPAEESK